MLLRIDELVFFYKSLKACRIVCLLLDQDALPIQYGCSKLGIRLAKQCTILIAVLCELNAAFFEQQIRNNASVSFQRNSLGLCRC